MHQINVFSEIEESTSSLLTYGVQLVFEGIRKDVMAHPGGLEGFARDVGVLPNTVHCWWNPNHKRAMPLSTLVTLLLVNPGTHTKSAVLEVADVFSQHREKLVVRKLEKLRKELGGALK
ncbi:MAG: hypothetical protein NOU37_04870 [Candidatus Brocadiales bacterium]|nr:hypothetical protein [Candidatus Bathyanammoxibius amoris]